MRKLTTEDIYKKADLSAYDIETTKDLTPLEGELIQQERAEKAVDFALKVNQFGYNLFVSGGNATKKRSYLKKTVEEFASKKEGPEDLIFIHNFEKVTEPILHPVPRGVGAKLKAAMETFIEEVKEDIGKMFTSSAYRKKIEVFYQSYDEQHEAVTEKYDELFAPYNVEIIQKEDGGLILVPINEEGEPLSQEEYDEFTPEEIQIFVKNKKASDLIFIDFSEEQEKIQREKEESLLTLELEMAKEITSPKIKKLKKQFPKTDAVLTKFVTSVEADLLENLSLLKKDDSPQMGMLPFMMARKEELDITKYQINLFVDNSKQETAPVIFVDNFNPNRVFGTVEYSMVDNVVTTNLQNIIAGDFAKANGGYIVLQVEDLFKNYYSWDKVKSIIKTKELVMNAQPYRDLVMVNSLRPAAIPLDVKIILIGDYQWFRLLNSDPEFESLFKVHAVFDSEAKRTDETVDQYLKFITKYIKETDLRPFDKEALAAVLEYSSRLAHNQEKLVLNFAQIYKLLDEANAWAEAEEKEVVDLDSIERALEESKIRLGFIQEYIDEQTIENSSLIDTEGQKVGEVNGLSVSSYGEVMVGRPLKLTANTFRGNSLINSPDRNVKMSGPIYDKSVETVSGFIGKKFGSKLPTSLTANILFEQNYGGIEGDSATIAIMAAIASDLSNVPVNQNIAVTGSMNQKGDIQIVGGVNEKIEGFYNACLLKGLTGDQGVVLPEGNVRHLMLSKEVREAVENGSFHIYSVTRIEEALDILLTETSDKVFKKIENRFGDIREEAKKSASEKKEAKTEPQSPYTAPSKKKKKKKKGKKSVKVVKIKL